MASPERSSFLSSLAFVGTRVVESIPVGGLQILTPLKAPPAKSTKEPLKWVHKGKVRRGAVEVAISRYQKRELLSDPLKQELNVLELFGRLDHADHVAEIRGISKDKEMTIVVQDLAAFGCLRNAFKDAQHPMYGLVSPEHKAVIGAQLVHAMTFLESVRLVHNDLSCRHLLISRFRDDAPTETQVKLTDFKLSVALPETKDHRCKQQPQATRFCAPETVHMMKMSHRSDVWQVGTTLWEMYSEGTAPWQNLQNNADVKAKLKDMAESLHNGDMSLDFPQQKGCTDAAHRALLSCLQADEQRRPTFRKLLVTLGELEAEPGDEPAEEEPQAEPPGALTPPQKGGEKSCGGELLTSIESGKVPESDETREACADSRSERPPSTDAPRTKPPSQPETDAEASSVFVVGGGVAAHGRRRNEGVEEFLRSDRAIRALGQGTADSICQEVDDLKAKESYLLDLVARMQEQLLTPQPDVPESPAPDTKLPPHQTKNHASQSFLFDWELERTAREEERQKLEDTNNAPPRITRIQSAEQQLALLDKQLLMLEQLEWRMLERHQKALGGPC